MKEFTGMLHLKSKAIVLLTARESQLAQFGDDILREEPKAMVRRVRGWKCRTESEFHDEIAAALQFPSSYGENWAAFSDLIRNFQMQSASPVVLIVTRSGRLFEQETHPALRDLVEIVTGIARRWSEPDPDYDLPTKVLKLVLQEDYQNIAPLKERLIASGCEFQECHV